MQTVPHGLLTLTSGPDFTNDPVAKRTNPHSHVPKSIGKASQKKMLSLVATLQGIMQIKLTGSSGGSGGVVVVNVHS